MSNSIGEKGKILFKDHKPPETKIQPKKSVEGAKIKFVSGKLKQRAKENYIPHPSTPVKASPVTRPVPSSELSLPTDISQRVQLKLRSGP